MSPQTVDHASRAHSPISPSRLKPLQICPGYESDDTPSAAASRGTTLHEVMDTGRIPDSLPDEDREIAQKTLALLADSESQSSYEPLKEAIESYLISTVKSMARIVTKSKTRDDDQKKKYNEMVQTMIDSYGYTADSAEEVLTYAANHLWRDS